jgi:hypothetical protein
LSIFDIIKRQNILNKSGGICAHCGVELTLKTFTVDHYIPRSKGGSSTMDNLIPLCSKCNSDKDSKILEPLIAYPYINIKYENELIRLYNIYHNKVGEKRAKERRARAEQQAEQESDKTKDCLDLSNIEIAVDTNKSILSMFLNK